MCRDRNPVKREIFVGAKVCNKFDSEVSYLLNLCYMSDKLTGGAISVFAVIDCWLPFHPFAGSGTACKENSSIILTGEMHPLLRHG